MIIGTVYTVPLESRVADAELFSWKRKKNIINTVAKKKFAFIKCESRDSIFQIFHIWIPLKWRRSIADPGSQIQGSKKAPDSQHYIYGGVYWSGYVFFFSCWNMYTGSNVLRIRDVNPGSGIWLFSIPDPGSQLSPSRISIKKFKYCNPKINGF
jgi:hypothetical protein